jgi:NitT/TauT family transport system substrate-binding protein
MRVLLARLGGVAVLALVIALSLPAGRSFAVADEPLTVRVAATANDTYAEAYYAQERGDFAKAGLNVEIMTFANGASVSEAVVSGAADIGISNVVQIGTAVQHGIPIRYFAGGGLYSTDEPTTALAVAQSATIRVAKDFEGTTIGVSTLKDTSSIATQAWLIDHGADLSKIHFVEMPFPVMGPSLARGTIAGAVISEPSLSAAKTAGARVFANSYDGIARKFLISGWFATQDYAKRNPAALKKFTQVIYAEAKWANTHRPDSATILVKYAKLDPAVVRAMARCQYADNLDVKLIQPALDAAAKYGALEHAMQASEIIAP